MGLLERARTGNRAALARVATLLENDDRAALAALDQVGVPAVEPWVVGVTGPPGAGKSTLIDALIARLRGTGPLAVLLVDPSSRQSGGAVLGDRVRMLDKGDDAVFIRSLASRGQEGGLAPATAALIDLFAFAGFGTVLLETVGVGQDGIDVRAVSQTTLVVQPPHAGDAVQALKAGILEIGDVFVVTKSDIPGAHRTVRDLNAMVQLGHPAEGEWLPRVMPVSVQSETGIAELVETMQQHRRETGEATRGAIRNRRHLWETSRRAEAAIRRTVERSAADILASPDRDQRTIVTLRNALHALEQPC